MKTSTILSTTCSLLLACVEASPLHAQERRQTKPSNPASMLSQIPAQEIHPFKVEPLPPLTSRPTAKRIRITYGPFSILGVEAAKLDKPLFRMDPGSTAWFSKIGSGFPPDATILRTNSTITLENGKAASIAEGVYNHHTVFFDMDKASPVITDCPAMSSADKDRRIKVPMMSIVAGTGEDRINMVYAPDDASVNSGFWLSKSDKIMMMGEVINYKNHTQKVFSVTDVEYLEGKKEGLLDAFSSILSVNMCGAPGADGRPKPVQVPDGQMKTTMVSDPIVVTTSGYIVNANGHLHDGGDTILLKINGKVVCDSKASYGGEGQETKYEDGKVWATLSSMTACEKPIKVNKGDKIEIEAKYDLEAHPARKHAGHSMAGSGTGEVMGLFGIGFAPDSM